MKKFMLVHIGFEKPTPEFQQAQMAWFKSLEKRVVDPGHALGHGYEITKGDTQEIVMDRNAMTGYTVIQAESMDEAVAIAKENPFVTSMRVYEAMSM